MRSPEEYTHEGGALEDDTGSGFTMIPFMGRTGAGGNKLARIGMAIGSLVAVTTCMLAMFGESSNTALLGESNVMSEADLSHGLGRSLMALNQSTQPKPVFDGQFTPHIKLEKAPINITNFRTIISDQDEVKDPDFIKLKPASWKINIEEKDDSDSH